MGEVWCARHRTLDELAAVKLLARSSQDEAFEAPESAAARFRLEAQLAARLSRKTRHIVRVTDHGEERGVAYLVMELLEGETLEARLLRRPKLPVAEVADLVAQMCRALVVAHEDGIVHRDLKPANVFLACDEDGRTVVKLLDFGIARTMYTRRVAQSFATGDGLVFGTPGYMSPEQACAAEPDARCDLWALATVAYQMLTGDLPVPGTTTEEMFANLHAFRIIPVHERAPELAPELAPFFRRAFAQPIADRYASVAELGAAFAAACAARAPAASDTSAAPAPAVWAGGVSAGPVASLAVRTLAIALRRVSPGPLLRRVPRRVMAMSVTLAACLILGVGAATVSRAGALRPVLGVVETQASPPVVLPNPRPAAPPAVIGLVGLSSSDASASSSPPPGDADADGALAGSHSSSSSPVMRRSASSASGGSASSGSAPSATPANRPRPSPRNRSDVL
ncbi:MAG: serine/threonine protein kinase [Polyangiaceae bacterium]|nr:serine/threonine protein kinase [Polyangiaceae bacterium]